MIIAQISDLHVAVEGSATDHRFQAAAHLERAVEHLNGLDPLPDLVIASGDLVESGELAEYERLAELLAPLRVPIRLMNGNHDDRTNLRAVFRAHEYLFERAEFICYALDLGPARLVALDTQLPGKSRGQVCARRAEWLDRALSAAPRPPTLLFMHHPPLCVGLAKMDRSRIEDTAALAEVVARRPSLRRIACGHVHRPIHTSWRGVPLSVAPSTAYQIALELERDRPLDVIREPPALLLHAWIEDESTFVTHQSYIQSEALPEPLYPES